MTLVLPMLEACVLGMWGWAQRVRVVVRDKGADANAAAQGLALQHHHVWLMQPPLPPLHEGFWGGGCLAACNAMQMWKLVSRPPPPPALPLPVAEAEERAGGRAVAYMWELLHGFVGLQRPPRGLHGGLLRTCGSCCMVFCWLAAAPQAKGVHGGVGAAHPLAMFFF